MQLGAHVFRQRGIFFERRRHHPQKRFLGRLPFQQANFKAIIETSRVADIVLERVKPFTDFQAAAYGALACAEPPAIPHNRVDFTVVRDVPEGLRKIPGRLGVSGVALMEDCEGRLKSGIAQIGVKLRQAPRAQQALVDDGLRRERTEVGALRRQGFRAFAQQRQMRFKRNRLVIDHRRDKKVPDLRRDFASSPSQQLHGHRDAPPSQDAQRFSHRCPADGFTNFLLAFRGKKHNSYAEAFGQVNSLLFCAGAKEFFGERGQQTGAVAAGAVRINSPAMRQPFQRANRQANNFVAGTSAKSRDKARTTGVVIRMSPVRVTGHASCYLRRVHGCTTHSCNVWNRLFGWRRFLALGADIKSLNVCGRVCRAVWRILCARPAGQHARRLYRAGNSVGGYAALMPLKN